MRVIFVLAFLSLSFTTSASFARDVACTAQEVVSFTPRVHVRCLEKFPDDAGDPEIVYFAARPQDARLYEDLRDFGRQAMTNGRLTIGYTQNLSAAEAADHNAAGCNPDNCRLVESVKLSEPGPYVMSFDVDGIARAALVYPALAQGSVGEAPVLFFFHGHTGTMWDSAARRRFHSLWPNAIIVYGQGLHQDSGGVTEHVSGTSGKPLPGWQVRFPYKAGPPVNYDNDLKYIDEIMERLKANHKVDLDRIFASGHSGGAFFTLSLIELRPDLFARFAPLGAYGRFEVNLNPNLPPWNNGAAQYVPLLTAGLPSGHIARPVLYAFGRNDTVFDNDGPYAGFPGWVNGELMDSRAGRTLFDLGLMAGCDDDAMAIKDEAPTLFLPDGPGEEPLFWWPYDGGHSWPEEANQVVVDFFRASDPEDPTLVPGAMELDCG